MSCRYKQEENIEESIPVALVDIYSRDYIFI